MKNTLTDRQLDNCTFIKTVLMLLVVLYHSCLFWTGSWFTQVSPAQEAPVLVLLSKWLGSFHIHCFTLVSGYIFYYLRVERGKYSDFKSFFFNKVKRLLVPYIFAAVIWVVPVSTIFSKYSVTEIVKKYVFATAPSQLWFLWMLFGVFMLFWPLTDFFKKHTISGMCIVCILHACGLGGGKVFPNFFCIWRTCQYIVFFWIGFKIRQYSPGKKRIPWFLWLAGDLLLFVAYVFCSPMGFLRIAVGFILNCFGAIVAFVVLGEVANHVKWKNSRLFKEFSRCSMTVYLLHQQVIYFIIVWLNGKVNPYLNALAIFIISTSISLLAGVFLLKNRWTRVLVGER